jgi:hypothetical protein
VRVVTRLRGEDESERVDGGMKQSGSSEPSLNEQYVFKSREQVTSSSKIAPNRSKKNLARLVFSGPKRGVSFQLADFNESPDRRKLEAYAT